MKKILFISVVSFILLSACSGGGGKNITFAIWAGGKELGEFEEIVSAVNEAAGDAYQITVESIPDRYIQKLSTQFSGKNAADLIWLSQNDIPAFAAMEALYDITELNAQTATPELAYDNFYPALIERASFQGKLYGLPWISNPNIVFFNAKMFADFGIPLPAGTGNAPDSVYGTEWTWEEFENIAAQFPNGDESKAIPGYGADTFGWITGGWPPIEVYLWSMGGDILDKDFNPVANSPESVAGLTLLKELLLSGITPPVETVWDQGYSESFTGGKIAMIIGGAADDFELRELTGFAREDIRYGLLPQGSLGENTSFNWTASTVMNANVKNPELAYQAMEDMTLAFFDWKATPPIMGGIDRIDTMLEGVKIPAKNTIVAAVENGARGGNYHRLYGEIDTWKNLYEPMLLDPNGFDPQTYADTLQERIVSIFEREGE